MDDIQSELDATTARVEDLRDQQEGVRERIASIELRIADLEKQRAGLSARAEERAALLYRQGSTGLMEALFEAENFGELFDRAEILSRVSEKSTEIFVRLSRSRTELEALMVELDERRNELAAATEELAGTSDELQDQFASVKDEYMELKKKLAEAQAAAPAPSRSGTSDGANPVLTGSRGMFCPVAGPVSFVDSWGAPRDGHTHQGVDMMADYGTPLVAIVSGSVSSGWSDTGGNSIFLSGSDGNSYWYLHNQENLVTSGHVSAGQQIGTVGDTGNAVGIPHLHFEYHPGGGGAINPYPLVASIC